MSTRPCLSSSATVAPAKTNRFISRASRRERVELGDPLDARLPALARIDVDGAVDAADEDDAAAEAVAELAGSVRRFFSSIVCSWVP